LLGGIGAQRDVADFAARAEGFAVNVEVGIGNGENFGWIGELADQVEHGGVAESAGVAERETADGAKMVFKLAGDRAFDAPVAGIVDARGHFVGEQTAIRFEEFDGENSDVIEGVKDAAGGGFGFCLQLCGKIRRGGKREAEDSAAMMIFDERIKCGFTGAGAHGEDGAAGISDFTRCRSSGVRRTHWPLPS